MGSSGWASWRSRSASPWLRGGRRRIRAVTQLPRPRSRRCSTVASAARTSSRSSASCPGPHSTKNVTTWASPHFTGSFLVVRGPGRRELAGRPGGLDCSWSPVHHRSPAPGVAAYCSAAPWGSGAQGSPGCCTTGPRRRMTHWGMARVADSSGDPASQLAPYLRSGEELLWSGRPDPAVTFTPADAFLIPFTIMWGGFALFWEIGVLTSDAPPFFVLWGVPFVLLGLYAIVGRFVYKKYSKRRTAYGITEGRALIAVGKSVFTDVPLRQTSTSIRRSRDGRHVSITFGTHRGWSPSRFYNNTGMDFLTFGDGLIGFSDVAQPDAVLTALERAHTNSSGGHP